MNKQIVVIGAGIGGLTTAAILSKAGMEVTVLEEQVYPGGCASTFFHKGYRFDAGATLAAGFYPDGPMELVRDAAGLSAWEVEYDHPAMIVHLPNGHEVACHNEESRWDEYRTIFGQNAVDFFQWQERTAELLWRFALRLPSWPVKSISDGISVINSLDRKLLVASPQLAMDLFRPVGFHLKIVPESLRLFVDGQLLISAQTTSEYANALYTASALDLPRRGVAHLPKGIGTLAVILVAATRKNGGKVLFRHKVTKIESGLPGKYRIYTKKNEIFDADIVIANLTPWNIAELMELRKPKTIRNLPKFSENQWGAFTLYVGVKSEAIPANFPLHHQILKGYPFGEGNSIFLSISPEWDLERAPANHRALTISSHTQLGRWWGLFNSDKERYEQEKVVLTEKILTNLESILPEIRKSIKLLLPGTPITFQRYTGRKLGWVGGFPQTSLFRAFHPQLGKNFWMVGDSIFPGQSTAAVALGGLRVANQIMK